MTEYDYWPEMRNGNLDIIDDRRNLNNKEATVFMDSRRFLPIANIGRMMKNTLEPIKDLKGPKPHKTHKKKERQTPYEQYERSESEDDSLIKEDEDSSLSEAKNKNSEFVPPFIRD